MYSIIRIHELLRMIKFIEKESGLLGLGCTRKEEMAECLQRWILQEAEVL